MLQTIYLVELNQFKSIQIMERKARVASLLKPFSTLLQFHWNLDEFKQENGKDQVKWAALEVLAEFLNIDARETRRSLNRGLGEHLLPAFELMDYLILSKEACAKIANRVKETDLTPEQVNAVVQLSIGSDPNRPSWALSRIIGSDLLNHGPFVKAASADAMADIVSQDRLDIKGGENGIVSIIVMQWCQGKSMEEIRQVAQHIRWDRVHFGQLSLECRAKFKTLRINEACPDAMFVMANSIVDNPLDIKLSKPRTANIDSENALGLVWRRSDEFDDLQSTYRRTIKCLDPSPSLLLVPDDMYFVNPRLCEMFICLTQPDPPAPNGFPKYEIYSLSISPRHVRISRAKSPSKKEIADDGKRGALCVIQTGLTGKYFVQIGNRMKV